MRERGSALMVSVIGITILLLISGIFFSTVVSDYRIETSEEKGLKAFYLAEAGIQYGIFQAIEIDKDGSKTEILTEPYKGTFTVSWQEVDKNKKIYLIQSEGTYAGITRKLEVNYSPEGS
jgi:hypothetical protein